jgi:hypothetical protein
LTDAGHEAGDGLDALLAALAAGAGHGGAEGITVEESAMFRRPPIRRKFKENNDVQGMHSAMQTHAAVLRYWPIMLIMSTQVIGVGSGCRATDDPPAAGPPVHITGLPSADAGSARGTSPALSPSSLSPPDSGARDAFVSTLPNPEFTSAGFEELHDRFLMPWHGTPQDRAALWARYQGKWVRWRGKLVSFTPSGATFKLLPSTLTFDVSAIFDADARRRLHAWRIGDQVPFIGRLDEANDLNQTFYLVHADVPTPPPSQPHR